MKLERLEPREAPAVFASSGADVSEYTDAGELRRTFTPFPDAPNVPVRVSASNGLVVVGAGEGGGPRMSGFDPATFAERWSVFVGNPDSRSGVNAAVVADPVRVEVPVPVEVPVTVPSVTAGDAAGWPVWVDASLVADRGADYVRTVVVEAARMLAPVNVYLTTDYPADTRPGEYTTARLLPSGGVGWRNAGGNVPFRAVVNDTLYSPVVAYAGAGGFAPRDARVLAHEVFHTVQPLNMDSHSDVVGLMDPGASGEAIAPEWAALVNANVARLQDGWRFGPVFHPSNGSFRFDYTDLIP